MSDDPETVRRLLEQDLIEWADDGDLRLVWADLLQIDGDPLGRLVVLDHAGESEGPGAARARAEAELLREALAKRLWASPPQDPGLRFHWRRGFVDELDVDSDKLSTAGVSSPRRRSTRRGLPPSRAYALEHLIPRLLAQPALRWLEVIRVHVDDNAASAWLSWALDGRASCGTLREIHVGAPARARFRPGGQWESGRQGNLMVRAGDTLVRSFRRLRQVSVGGEMLRLPCCEGSTQTRAHYVRALAGRPLTSPNRAALIRGLWDASVLVHQAAFATARELGPAADFLVRELLWFVEAPVSRKDPRPTEALATLTAIGPAAGVALAKVLANAEVVMATSSRCEAFMIWLAGPCPWPAEPRAAAAQLVEQVVTAPEGRAPSLIRAARQAKRALARSG